MFGEGLRFQLGQAGLNVDRRISHLAARRALALPITSATALAIRLRVVADGGLESASVGADGGYGRANVLTSPAQTLVIGARKSMLAGQTVRARPCGLRTLRLAPLLAMRIFPLAMHQLAWFCCRAPRFDTHSHRASFIRVCQAAPVALK